MLNDDQVQQAVALIVEASRTARALAGLPASCRPHSMDDAYRIQDRVFADHFETEHGWCGGWFVAATNPEMQRQLGLSDAYAARWGRHRFLTSGSDIEAPAFPVALEAEVSFRIGKDLPPVSGEYTVTDIVSAVRSVHASVEVVISCFTDWMNQAPLNLIAEGGPDQYLVYAEDGMDVAKIDLSDIDIAVSVNEEVVACGSSNKVMGNPINVMVWLANHASRRGHGLRAGQLCNTGMCAPPWEIVPGDRAMVDFGPLGRVELQLVPGRSS